MLTNEQIDNFKIGDRLMVVGEKRSFIGIIVRFSPSYRPPAFGLKEYDGDSVTQWYETRDQRLEMPDGG